MDINERIVYSDEQALLSMKSALDSMKVLRYDSKYRATLGDALLDKLAQWEKTIEGHKDDPFTLVVIGEFKRGKSMFINALLGEEVVTSDVTPETVTLNRIRYGAHRNVALLSGNRELVLDDQDLRRDALQSVLSKVNEHVTQLELHRPCELLKRMTIIDTPGTEEAMMDFSDLVKDSLLQADAVVYVYNVRYPLSMTEQIFLKSAVLPQKHTALYLVGNYADTLEDEDSYVRVQKMLKDRIERLLPDADVIMLSALDELCRAQGKRRPCPPLNDLLENQFTQLRDNLNQVIDSRGNTVVVDRMQRMISAMIADLETELQAIENGLRMTGEEAAETLSRVRSERDSSVETQTQMRERIQKAVADMEREAQSWMLEFMARIEEESRNLQGQNVDTLFKYFECYCIDMLQKALGMCLDYHQERLYELMDSVSQELSEKLAAGMNHTHAFNFRINVNNRLWTKGDTMSLAVSQVGVGSLLGGVAELATQFVAGLMRGREKNQHVNDVINQIKLQMSGLTASVSETVHKLYGDLAAKADRLAADYYEEELKNAERLSNQTIMTARKTQEDKEHIQAMANSVHAILADLSNACG